MENVIITGACGYIGAKLSKALINQNIFVHAMDRLTDPPFHDKFYQYYNCDLENNIFPSNSHFHNTGALFHLAWNGVNSDYRNDFSCQLKNIMYLLNVLSFAKLLNIPKVIILGSASEYADSVMPITGNNKSGAIDAYGAAKSACHIISQAWSLQNNMPLIWLIPSSIYGPGRNDNNVLTYTIIKLLKKERPVFTSLEQYWDYIYIDDFINGLSLIYKKGIIGKTYVIGYGAEKKLLEYISIIKNTINSELPLGIGEKPYKNKRPDNCIIDISELQKDTGFSPNVSFEIGIKNTIEWYKHNLNLL